MKLSDACSFMSELTGISVMPISSNKDITTFCKKHYFHRAQNQLTASYLKTTVKELPNNTISFIQDYLFINYVIIKTDTDLILVGPYINQDMTEASIKLLKDNYQLDDLNTVDYKAYRDNYQLKEDADILHDCRVLLNNTGFDASIFHQEYNYNEKSSRVKGWEYQRKNFENLINERYRVEQEMMERIFQGDDVGAIKSYRKIHNNVKYMVSYGGSPNDSRISSGITRSTVRMAAVNAGLPPIIIDEISGKSSRIIKNLNSRDDMYKENERMIQDFANAINRFRRNSYSTMVYGAIHQFESDYSSRISIEETAERLGVSECHLINQFKKETGLTPNAYLNSFRIRQAKRLLRSSQYSIQQIAEEVGVFDSNYFVKLFKKDTGITPSAYRKNYYIKEKRK
ncbi:MAG: helix-turn-helix transcriptional regulator [Erysipelotrichaceae bacterium]|nr:helix-turn-helix transcriptional regulator [Erysipelotrichaceae bacterium]